jgi:3-isopropylmalate dehydratase small subunit
MEKFIKHTGNALPLRRSNVDTDQIIPAVYLKRITKSGFEDGLFAAWRNDPEFVLNKDAFKKGTVLIAGADFGTGSSREHAAMEPRFRGGVVIFARSFARIHETNLKKQGLVPLTFADPNTYELIGEDDRINVLNLPPVPGKNVHCQIVKPDGTIIDFEGVQTFSPEQVEWFTGGSALNIVRAKVASGN